MSKKTSQKGVSIYLALMIMAILLAMVLGLTAILINQIKGMREMSYSVVAFYAADTGVEKVLANQPLVTPEPPLENGASYDAQLLNAGDGSPPCDATNSCIRSVGTYKGVSRAIEVRR